jgi:hypothetical protein
MSTASERITRREPWRIRHVTDLDILAFRFADARHDVIHGGGRRPLAGRALAPDPILGCPPDRPDMIVGEVKEGATRLNAAMRDPIVPEVGLSRFGCCPAEHAPTLTRQPRAGGHATAPAGHSIRMVAFGDAPDSVRQRLWTTVPMRHVVLFLRGYLRERWAVLHHAPIRDPVLGVLALIENWGVDAQDQGSAEPVPQLKRERVRGRILRGQDANRRRTV